MRIIAGYLGGRQFTAPNGHKTHPMSDKARGGLFNALGDIKDLTVLDAFAGTGALGFEALSRGASRVILVDNDRNAQNTIDKNISELGLNQKAKAIKASVSAWSDNNDEATFDLVLCDPPYDKLQLELIQKLTRHIKSQGLMVLSWPGKLTAPELMGLEMLKDQNYGDAQLVFYRKIS